MNVDWITVARAMRDEGHVLREIAARLDRNVSTVSRALASEEKREKRRQSRRKPMRDVARRPLQREDTKSACGFRLPAYVGDASFTEAHEPRAIRKLPGDPLSAARRFAAGEITREQLSRELRGDA